MLSRAPAALPSSPACEEASLVVAASIMKMWWLCPNKNLHSS